MKVEHVAIWVKDLEATKDFYCRYFELQSGEKYTNTKKRFTSYFLSFPEGARIELMHREDISGEKDTASSFGLTHLAISVGTKEKVDQLTEQLRADGIRVVSAPRTTGDGYYESVIEDPEGNQIEITI